MSTSNLVLHFAVEDSARKKRFSMDMEGAAILCVAEAERRKKTGILRGAVETLTFISKLRYPFWAIPWEDGCLLIDGMKTVSASIPHSKPPDVEAFTEHLKRSSTVWELYRSALRSHRETFSGFTSQTEILIEGLVTDKELLADMSALMKEAKIEAGEASSEPTSLLQPRIDKENAVKIGEKIIEHHNQLQSEIKGLQFAVDSLSEETKTHVDKLRQELEQKREKYEAEISNVRAEVEKRKAELEKEQDEKTEQVATAHKKEIEAKLEEKERWEKELVRLEQDKSEYEKRKELRKQKDDEIGEARSEARLREIKNQISTVKGKVKALSDFINRSNKETEKTMKELGGTYQKLIDNEMRKITELENLRDSEVEKKRKQMEELQQETLAITDRIERLIDQKRADALSLKEDTIQWKTNTPILIQVPFYVIQYSTGKEKRYRIRSPVIVKGHEGLMMKIRRRIMGYSLESKISTLLNIRSKALERLMLAFEKRLNSDKTVLRSIDQLAMSYNLLTSVSFKESLNRGLGELEAEGWIKPEEKAVILNVYAPS